MLRKLARTVLISFLLVPAIAEAKGPLPDQWVEAESKHFTVLTNSSDRDALRLVSQFERMRLVFETMLPGVDDSSAPPIKVLALKDRKGLQALEPVAYLAKKQIDLAGFFLRSPDKNYILVRLDANQEHAYSTVYHEYTHYMLRKQDGWLPLWLNEGLAQFYEHTDFDEKKAWLGEASPQALELLKRNELLPIRTLLTVDARSPFYHEEEKGSIFYAESWALTHYLMVNDRVRGTHRMRDYTDRLAQGEDAVSAARESFGDLDKLQRGLSDYVMERKFMYFIVPAELPVDHHEVVLQRATRSQADAVRANLMAYTGRVDEARALNESVLLDDPGNALAHETMGLLRFRGGDLAAAKQDYDRATALDPASYLSQFYSSWLAIHGSAKDESPGDGIALGTDDAIESGLNASIRLNSDFAPAYDTLAMFYAARHRRLEEAHALNLRAVEIEPARLSYRLNCAEVLVEQRQFADALTVLEQARRIAKTPEEMAAVANHVSRVEYYQTAVSRRPRGPISEISFEQ